MINFIVCDDNVSILNSVKEVISKTMMKNRQSYLIHSFTEYDAGFKQKMNEKLTNKIYILDIETKSASGIDIARRIRQKDINSIIIFLTSHDELGSVLLKEEIMFLTFINKFDNYKHRLESAIKMGIKIMGETKILHFEYHGSVFNIPEKDILYVTRDNVERKVIIKTDSTEFKLSKTLAEMLDLLSDCFIVSHRSCIVNSTRINVVDKRTRKITFDNGDTLDMVSKKHIREVMN